VPYPNRRPNTGPPPVLLFASLPPKDSQPTVKKDTTDSFDIHPNYLFIKHSTTRRSIAKNAVKQTVDLNALYRASRPTV